MATKKQIADDIRAQCGNLIPFGRLAKYLGLCPNKAREYLADVPAYDMGRKRCFFAIDVAKKLESCQIQ